MYSFEIVSLFKSKDSSLQELEKRYIKRMQPFAKVGLTEQSVKMPDSMPPESRMEAEAAFALERVSAQKVMIALDERGKELNSFELSNLVKDYALNGQSAFSFVIGGAHGLHSSVHQRADKLLALSKLTFTSSMARMILLEQLYRAMTIIAGKPYHKE